LAYTEADIIHLIVFYNENFGIVEDDCIEICIAKFQGFLTAQ